MVYVFAAMPRAPSSPSLCSWPEPLCALAVLVVTPYAAMPAPFHALLGVLDMNFLVPFVSSWLTPYAAIPTSNWLLYRSA